MFRFFKKQEKAAPPLNGNLVRRHMVFYGRVQGVGFRYQAVYIARTLGVTGWVRNCMDGTVEMEAQGYPADLDALVEELRHQRYIRIERVEVEAMQVKAEQGFRETY